jgi:hypothetical protein
VRVFVDLFLLEIFFLGNVKKFECRTVNIKKVIDVIIFKLFVSIYFIVIVENTQSLLFCWSFCFWRN